MFTSTSKITFPGAGVSALACSEAMMKYICKRFSVMIISYDKMNQLRHVRFLKNKGRRSGPHGKSTAAVWYPALMPSRRPSTRS